MQEIRPQAYRLKTGSRLERAVNRAKRSLEPIIDRAQGMSKDAAIKLRLARLPSANLYHSTSLPLETKLGARKLCLYASYSRKSKVSDMVFAQLDAYARQGFSIVFITMSKTVADADRQRLLDICSTIVHRESYGRDFGAWAHAAALLNLPPDDLDELLLTNDSNVGPIFPLDDVFESIRTREGILGLTESLQNGAHLQSYFILARGKRAIGSTFQFLSSLKLSYSKLAMVRRGELAFTPQMLKAGNSVRAMLSYEMMENALLDDMSEQAELWAAYPEIFGGRDNTVGDLFWRAGNQFHDVDARRKRYLLRRRLFKFPLNPTHQLAWLLVKKFNYPFIKTELLVKNPTLMPAVPDWRNFIAAESPVSVATIEAHLETI